MTQHHLCAKKAFALTFSFVVAAHAYSQSFYKLLGVANVKQMNRTSFSRVEECCMTIHMTADCVISCFFISDKPVAHLVGLVPAHLPRSHFLHRVCT